VSSKKYSLKTLGCKANLYDSQLIEAELQKRGWVAALTGEVSDLTVVNSCTVTDEADKQSRKMASTAAEHPQTKVVMTGCGAEVDPVKMGASGAVDYIVGNQDKNRLVDLVLAQIDLGSKKQIDLQMEDSPDGITRGVLLGGVANYGDLLSRHPMDREWATPESSFMLPPVHLQGETGRRRGFLKVQEGCNSFCTYCIIPYGRGPGRSLPIQALVGHVRSLVAQGIREVIITGTNIGDYGADLSADGKATLEALIETLLSETTLERLRISSLDPVEISPRLRKIYSTNPRLCAHFHVSLQSPHSKILRLMKRKYAAKEVEECLSAITELPAPIGGVYAGMDVITGFPGESREDFEWGVERLRSLPWTRLHVFPFSERVGTPATRLPNSVPKPERARRAKILRTLSLERMQTIHRGILDDHRAHGRMLDRVLIESAVKGPNPGQAYVGGYTSNYFRVIIPVASVEIGESMKNQIFTVRPESVLVDSSQGDVAFMGCVTL
jgi:threonylcarbamoyladenosine tRNA methylthiotransferase MtaB